MKKFELDTNYDNGRLLVIARNDKKVFFLKDEEKEFLACEIFIKNGNEATKINSWPIKTIEADENAPYSPANHSDIEEWFNDLENAFDDEARKKRHMHTLDGFTPDDISNVIILVELLKKRL